MSDLECNDTEFRPQRIFSSEIAELKKPTTFALEMNNETTDQDRVRARNKTMIVLALVLLVLNVIVYFSR